MKPFKAEMLHYLLVMSLRFLTEEQRASLCVDLYVRSELKDKIDEKKLLHRSKG
jgi:hypothetical protein